jgi:hypothetical protein
VYQPSPHVHLRNHKQKQNKKMVALLSHACLGVACLLAHLLDIWFYNMLSATAQHSK